MSVHNQNWAPWYKWYLTVAGGILILNAYVTYHLMFLCTRLIISANRTFASAAPSNLAPQIEAAVRLDHNIQRFSINDWPSFGYDSSVWVTRSLLLLCLCLLLDTVLVSTEDRPCSYGSCELMNCAGPLLWGPLSELVTIRKNLDTHLGNI